MANFQLPDNQKVPYMLVALDAKGDPAALLAGQSIAVSSSDSLMASVVSDASPAAGSVGSGFIVAGAKLGTVQISAAVTNADGSAGPTGQVSIDIVSGPAATIGFNLGVPVLQ